jgi:glycosyltransferase involved in cell wall biosynthesis
MSGRIHIFSVGDEHTTARYFERVLHAAGQSFTYCDKVPDFKAIDAGDLFFFIDPAPDWPIGLERIPCTSVAYLIDVHLDLASRLRLSQFFDVVFVAQKDFVSAFESIGHPNVHWLPVACDPTTHSHPHAVRQFDVGFVGKLGQQGTWRNDVLTTVLPHYKTNEYNKFYSPRAMADVYGQSKIVVNASINGDVNMRLFEALASGALLITDRIKNGLDELFLEGIHFVGYTTVEEAIKKIDYYLANTEERMKIAAAGQELALDSHTYRHRWTDIEKIATTSEKQAPAREAIKSELGRLYAEIFVSLQKPWRIHGVLRHYGPSVPLLSNFLRAWGRWLNSRVPLTPNAIRWRLRAR